MYESRMSATAFPRFREHSTSCSRSTFGRVLPIRHMVEMSSASARKPRTAPQRRTREAASKKPASEVSQQSPPERAVVGPAHHNEGHGRRLTAAFEALENFPALAESRKRVLRVVTQDQPS